MPSRRKTAPRASGVPAASYSARIRSFCSTVKRRRVGQTEDGDFVDVVTEKDPSPPFAH
jgi:hypothetical protein